MSKQEDGEEQVLVQLAEVVGCCSPLARQPLSADQSVELARVFKAMGDPVRLRLLSLIASHAGGEACVCDLTEVFDLSGPTISHRIKVLRKAGLITGQRRGTWVYYPGASRAAGPGLPGASAGRAPGRQRVIPDGIQALPVMQR